MSARAMTTPADLSEADRWRHAELCMLLPPSWPIDPDDDRHGWPFRLLRSIARMPHRYGSWISHGHTIGEDEPFAPDTRLSCALVVRPFGLHEGESR
jgi:hypothetical protein